MAVSLLERLHTAKGMCSCFSLAVAIIQIKSQAIYLYFLAVLSLLQCESAESFLISILPKNQAAPIEIVISDFFRILKTFIAFDSLCHKSPKAKGKL